MKLDEMILGLVRAAELKEREEGGQLWDDESRQALAAARFLGWGKSQTGRILELGQPALTADDVAALEWMRKHVVAPGALGPGGHGLDDHQRHLDALALVARLLAHAKGAP